ncbi:LysR family transcriptional regulator [Verminephrobacter eiseniae]|nr:LysR family transcriptional regulator [Verminephrobacter eiseniae]MCW5260372.1 LysR family transcriptional regulator [Verminephrobacter eiseniae]MCW5292157.1 LysR family transcriptional regulator [Verminephrobacter eiseniae]MCW8187785.1 LysR family transcriptional regulator [Verminephrobacter eiseniae]MCW8222506.1 LysR family transcriptional regulator [Verminephrobacter eiseniae]
MQAKAALPSPAPAMTTMTTPAAAPARHRAVLGQLSDMDLRLLQVFKSVVECGGMSAAELELNIGTSTVSRHMKDLETRLGLTLCRRGRAGFALTAEGQRVYDETLRLLASVHSFRASIDDIHSRMGGQLALAIFDKTASNPAARIGQAIAAFAAMAPDVQLQLHVGSINAIERGVIDGSYQVGIIPAHRSSQSLAYSDLFAETMLLYGGAGHPLCTAAPPPADWQALRNYPFAGLGYHSPNMALSHQARLRRAATGFDQESIATLILSGRFLGFLPDHYAEAFERQGRMQAVNPALFRYECQFVSLMRRSPAPTRAAQAFAQCLQQAHRAVSPPASQAARPPAGQAVSPPAGQAARPPVIQAAGPPAGQAG